MKRRNILKIALSFVLMLSITGIYGQANPPDNSVPQLTALANYVELQGGSGLNWSGSATPIAGYTNYYTVGNAAVNLVEYDNSAAGTTPALVYIQDANVDVDYVVPIVVIPDQDLHPTTMAGTTFDPTNLTNNSSWVWTETAAGDAAFANVTLAGGGAEGAFETGGGLRTAADYCQRYLNVGNAVENYNVTVAEQSLDGAGVQLCVDGTVETFIINVVAAPTVALNSADDDQVCYSVDGLTYDLVLDIVGTPPFGIGLYYTLAEEGETALYDFEEIITDDDAVGGTDQARALGAGGEGTVTLEGVLAGGPVNWTYTITLEVDPGNDGPATAPAANEINMGLVGGKKTTHSIDIMWINDVVSRKSDRLGTVGSNNLIAEVDDHVLYEVAAGVDMDVELFPVPVTGNIFALPN
ncbi:hypothetical protein ACFLSE_09005 [Bacteroidota bacterium]